MKQFPWPEPNKPSQRAAAFFEAVSASEELDYLYSRWQDESKYEDINDYQKPFDKIAFEFAVRIVKMNRRPFGFDFEADGRTYRFSATVRENSFKRIA